MLEQSRSDIVYGDVKGIRHTCDIQDPLGGAGQHSLARMQTSTAGFLDFLDFAALATDNRSHMRVGNNEAERGSTGTRQGRLVEWLVIDAAHQQAKGFANCIQSTRYSQNALWIRRNAFANIEACAA